MNSSSIDVVLQFLGALEPETNVVLEYLGSGLYRLQYRIAISGAYVLTVFVDGTSTGPPKLVNVLSRCPLGW